MDIVLEGGLVVKSQEKQSKEHDGRKVGGSFRPALHAQRAWQQKIQCGRKDLLEWSIVDLNGQKLGPIRGSSLSLQTLQIRNCKVLMSIEAISALQHLGCSTIDGCPMLVCTTSTALQIDKLVIHDPMLLLTVSFRNITSLRELWIINCSELESISDQMEEWLLQRQTTLNSLSLGEASSLKSLPDSLQTFSSLKELSLAEARLLQSVPRLPSSLERLAIVGCNETLMDRCQEEGADWPNINRICNIWID